MEHASSSEAVPGIWDNAKFDVEGARAVVIVGGKAWNGREPCFIFIFRLEFLDFETVVLEVSRVQLLRLTCLKSKEEFREKGAPCS
jgi:hypothetical protein